MLPKAIIVLVFGVLATCHHACDKDLILRPCEWTGGPFDFSCGATKDVYVKSGKYISKNVIATRFQIYKDEAIVALPRYRKGCPATLARLPLKQLGCESVLLPFPCWSNQDEMNVDGLVSIVDIFIDCQDILWVLDSGVTDTLEESPLRYSKPKVVAYSLKNGKQLKTLDLSGLVVQASRLQYIVVEYSQDGKPYVYISDAATRSILVFDIVANKGYRVVLPKAVIAGSCRRDVLYIALIQKPCGDNYLIFTYLSSPCLFSIRTDYLRSGSAAGRIVDLGGKPQKMVILGTDLGSAIFFRYEGLPEVYRWDSNTPFAPENFVVVHRSPNCLLATCVAADLKRQRLRVLESNFPDYIQNTVGCGALQMIEVIEGTL